MKAKVTNSRSGQPLRLQVLLDETGNSYHKTLFTSH